MQFVSAAADSCCILLRASKVGTVAQAPKSAHSLFLSRHERIVCRAIYAYSSLWNELNVSFLGTADVGDCLLRYFNTSFAVLFNYVASHIRVSLSALNKDSVEST